MCEYQNRKKKKVVILNTLRLSVNVVSNGLNVRLQAKFLAPSRPTPAEKYLAMPVI
jgi:hypothetical protein